MRMNLYAVELVRASGRENCYIVADSAERASELVREHHDLSEEQLAKVGVERIDEGLQGRQRLGLDDMLERGPVGFASFSSSVGWVVHAAAVHQLRLFRVETPEGKEKLILAPNPDIAAAIWCGTEPLEEGEHSLFRIWEGVDCLTDEQRDALEDFLEFGPVGVLTWRRDRWLLD